MTYTPKIVMDSGAYSAWTKHAKLEVEKYCDFLFENADWITGYISLDVIIPSDPDEAATRSYANFKYMQGRGLKPWPVLHHSEDINWLHRYIDEGCDYICLAAANLRNRPALSHRWYEVVWSHLINKDGSPIVRTHLLGDARPLNLFWFPWTTSDSTSWKIQPQVFTAFPIKDIMLSTRFDRGPGHGTRDVNTLSDEEWAMVFAELDRHGICHDVFEQRPGRLGHSTDYDRDIGVRTSCFRSFMTAKWFQDLEAEVDMLGEKRLSFRTPFVGDYRPPDIPAACTDSSYQMYMVISGNNSQVCPIMRAAGQERLLVSYYYLRPDRRGGGSSRLAELRNFARDPESVYTEGETRFYAQAVDSIFERNRSESTGTVSSSERVRPTYRRPSA